jgi:hypothetical protein|tara:strand:+ start:5570 stop:5893 length:324 start_codon:yes stop_codon:yes gene_type:complete
MIALISLSFSFEIYINAYALFSSMNLLKKSEIPLSRSQIAEKLNINKVLTSRILNSLLRFDEVKCIELNLHQVAELLKWKSPWRRTRFYYCSSISGSKGIPSFAKGK